MVALVVTVLSLASCGGHGSATRTSSPTSPAADLDGYPLDPHSNACANVGRGMRGHCLGGRCTFRNWGQGPGASFVSARQGLGAVSTQFSLMASDGKRYEVFAYGHDQWAAQLPAGKYRAVGAAGCPNPETSFVVKPRKTLEGGCRRLAGIAITSEQQTSEHVSGQVGQVVEHRLLVAVEIGLAGNGMVARTILYSMRSG